MKVHETHDLIPGQIRKKAGVKDEGEKPFSQIMDEARLGRGIQAGQTGLPSSGMIPEGVLIIDKPGTIQPFGTGVEKAGVLRELEQTLDLIDFYAAKLGDGSFPVHDMDSLVNHLEERLEGLRTLEQTPGVDGRLRDIISDTVLTISRETAKFRRGDYAEAG
jgi:hypothetical protein